MASCTTVCCQEWHPSSLAVSKGLVISMEQWLTQVNVVSDGLQWLTQVDGHHWVAAWRSGNVIGCINEVTLRRAWLVLGWVTVFGG